MNRLFVVLVGIVAVVDSTALAAQAPRIVQVGDRPVEVVAIGAGAPTLVLESAAGEGVSQWRGVLPDLAKHTRVVAYSRAGHGRSGTSVEPVSPQTSVRELHELLAVLKERGPIVIAGHSWGGLLARLYVSTYPTDVAGIVLVDGTHENVWRRWEVLEPSFRIFDTVRAMIPKMPPATRGDFEQFLAVETDGRVDGMRPLPDMPLAVITAAKPCAPDREWVCRDARALRVTRELQSEWAARSTNSIHIVSAHTEHYVMNDQPDLIVTAVKFVLAEVRSSSR